MKMADYEIEDICEYIIKEGICLGLPPCEKCPFENICDDDSDPVELAKTWLEEHKANP